MCHSMVGYERILGCRQFQNSIAESSKSLIEKKIKTMGVASAFRIMEREIIHCTTDSRFTFIGLERNPESVKSLEGCTKCWVEEARNVNAYSMEILIPTIRESGSECWWSWNPKYKIDPVDEYFRGEFIPEDCVVREVDYNDNPYWFNTTMPAEKALMFKVNKDKHDHIWGGGYDEIGEARIFQNTRIGRIPIPEHIVPLFGLDFGSHKKTSDPNAMVKVYVLEDTKQIYIAQEGYGRCVLGDLATLCASLTESQLFPIVADSARPETIEFLNSNEEYRFNVIASRKGPGSVKAGIEWLQGYDIVIDPICTQMIYEAGAYKYKIDPLTRLILPVPADADNHLWDAVRYATEAARSGQLGGITIIGGRRKS